MFPPRDLIPNVELSTSMPLKMTVRERCLIYLLDRADVTRGDPASGQLVQDRIAESIHAGRPHVSRAMKRLAVKAHVVTDKIHVRGKSRKIMGYFITPEGVRKAREVQKRIEEEEVTVVDIEGRERKVKLFEVRSLLPRKPKLLQLAMNVDNGRIDLRRFLELHKRMHSGKIYDVREAISVPHFSGREEMLSHLDRFMEETKVRVLLLVGLPGVGKTALASKWVAGLKGRMHVLWRNVRPEMTAGDSLRDLAGVLHSAGRTALMEYLRQPGEDWRERSIDLLKRDLPGIDSLLILDNAHLANDDLGRLLAEMPSIEPATAILKILLLARERVPFLRAGDIARGRVREKELQDLLQPEAEAMMSAMRVDRAQQRRIWELCGGHPLSIELAAEGGVPLEAVRRTTVSRFAREVLTKLDSRLHDAMVFAAVFEESVPLSLLGAHGRELMRLCLLRDAGGGRASMHDLVREAVIQSVPSDQLAALHRRAGELLASSREPGEALEAVRHFVQTEAFREAETLVFDRGPEFIDAGFAEKLLSPLEKLAWTSKNTKRESQILLLRGHALFALGRWTDAAKAYERCSGSKDKRIAAEALLGQGKAEVQRHSPLAFAHLKKAREMFDGLGTLRLLAETQYWIGGNLEEVGRLDQARDAYELGRAVALQVGDRRWEGLCAYGIGGILSFKKDYLGAIEEEREALHLLEREGQRLEIAKVCAGIGGEALELEEYDESESHLLRAIAEARATGAVGILSYALFNLASLRNEVGRTQESTDLFQEAFNMFDHQGKYYEASICAAWLASFASTKGNEVTAMQLSQRANRLLSKTTEPALRARALRSFSRAELAAGRKDAAKKHLNRAIAEARNHRLAGMGRELAAELRKIA